MARTDEPQERRGLSEAVEAAISRAREHSARASELLETTRRTREQLLERRKRMYEIRFPGGDFEIRSSEGAPETGQTFRSHGHRWRVIRVVPGHMPVAYVEQEPSE